MYNGLTQSEMLRGNKHHLDEISDIFDNTKSYRALKKCFM